MFNKKIVILALILFSLLTISGVSASEITNDTSDLLGVDNDDAILSVNDDEVLGSNPDGTFTDLAKEIANATGELNLTRNYIYSSSDSSYKNGIKIDKTIIINGNGHTIDAKAKARIFYITSSDVVLENINFVKGTTGGDGGAVYFSQFGSLINCNFTDSKATGNNVRGGAVYFAKRGNVTNCNFVNNTDESRYSYGGGAIYISGYGNVTNCNFTNNTASDEGGAVHLGGGNVRNCNFVNNIAGSSEYGGGAIYIDGDGNVTNCNFTNNTASCGGGAIYFAYSDCSCTVTDCNFTNNTAFNDGGAIYIDGDGNDNVRNCNFADNQASHNGGAVYFFWFSNVRSCNFTNNSASHWGGAVYFDAGGNVTNCNFTDNKATDFGSRAGAVYFSQFSRLINCNFTDNQAYGDGGAVYFASSCDAVINCNFADNQASGLGGAVYFYGAGNVTNCNFTGNNATNGSAIYFYTTSSTKTVSNSRFLNNRANAEDLEVTKNDNAITITFTGNNNLLNAIYSRNGAEVKFTDVTYWGANGITTTGSSATPVRSNKEAGQNITVGVFVNGELVLNDVRVTDENGMIVLNINAGENYFIGVRHDTDSYYTEAEGTISKNAEFNVNVTPQTTHNRTVNITAKSNIYNEFMPGKLLFVLPGGTEISADYGGNGTWWAVHTFDDYGAHNVGASYGLDNVTVHNAIINITKVDSTLTVGNIVFDYNSSGSSEISFTGALGVNASVIDHPEAVVDATANTITVSGLNAGNYNLTVTTIPDDDHNPVTRIANITVNKLNSSVIINPVSHVVYPGDAVVVFSVTNPTDVSYVVTDKGGNVVDNGTIVDVGADLIVSGLGVGEYTVTIANADNDNCVGSSDSAGFIVKVNADISAVYDDGAKELTVTLVNDVSGAPLKGATVFVNVGGAEYSVKINGAGKGVVSLADLAPGTYNTIISYNGGAKCNPVNTALNILVKANANLSAVYSDATKELTVTLINSITGAPLKGASVAVNVGGVKYAAKINGAGKGVVSLVDLTPGLYDAKVTYNGGTKCSPAETAIEVIVKK